MIKKFYKILIYKPDKKFGSKWRTNHWLCGDNCQSLEQPCNEKCPEKPEKLILSCEGKCELESTFSERYICNGECTDFKVPCNRTCLQDGITQWFCNNECISVNEHCNGQCSSYPKRTFWKCPNSNVCVDSSELCSIPPANNQYSCPNGFEKSRHVCENLYQYNMTLNCEEKGLLTCKGHRKQCIQPEYLCDGFFQCMDRSDESNCSREKIELDYNIFTLCRGQNNEHGFKCDENNCVLLQHWCSNKKNLAHLVSISSTFYAHILCQYFSAKKFLTQNTAL
jgi:hypothetical protein